MGELKCPMHEEPLKLIPQDFRKKFTEEINRGRKEGHRIHIEGDLDPACNFIFNELLNFYKGDWTKVVDHVKVVRIMLSEKGRVGIGTFQPKNLFHRVILAFARGKRWGLSLFPFGCNYLS